MNFNFKNLTQNEIDFRDKFWGPKISKKAPSLNFLVIIRIIGAILLFFFQIRPCIFFYSSCHIIF
ncbi:hypothetical protein COV23_02395 [Candidatus Wolfebacteria bacterium CG10_big_fil_rev_8_21_14_0_10_31_9]|uniref:Uncharacterized protein n=1 Tax=Candidatus Wolfebacteria bacterium CG10_big_fil_rev_8_21_14_0_10_31_9 TaxID=1975070 RepID=A0A2H0RBQ3_9BACT|nr:MAG: hypothetical protein COV23_02395 [Candidatus Wolfebacteria bacterium CG10_big_fil_rev_8_21_14_0_10_31_9]